MLTSCLLAAALCGQTTINDVRGPTVLDGELGPFVIEAPAVLGKLTIHNGAQVTVNGGTLSSIELYGTSLTLHGGRIVNRIAEPMLFAWDGTDVSFYVRDITPESLASLDALNSGNRFGEVRLRLASGDLVNTRIGRSIDGTWPVWSVFYEGDSLLDAGLDGLIGITELNNVRNTFGSDAAAGDFTLDGEVGIQDLNLVRNHFGTAYFPPRDVAAVPEPASCVLAAIAAAACWLQVRHRRPRAGRAGG